MLISFELSMPVANSWNGQWSGSDDLHVIIRNLKTPPKLGSYKYAFGDGWVARVDVREVTSSAARKLRKQSKGFCSYDWMVKSIIERGEIKASHEVAGL